MADQFFVNLLETAQSGQVAQVMLVISQGNLITEHGPVSDNQRLLQGVAVALEPVGQVGHIALHRGLVGRPARPHLVQPGQMPIGGHIQTGFELALV